MSTRTNLYLNSLTIIYKHWASITLQQKIENYITKCNKYLEALKNSFKNKPYFLKEWQVNADNLKQLVLEQQLGTQHSVY